jgi:hypothetical protein
MSIKSIIIMPERLRSINCLPISFAASIFIFKKVASLSLILPSNLPVFTSTAALRCLYSSLAAVTPSFNWAVLNKLDEDADEADT